MKEFNVENYRKALKKYEIALVGTPVKNSLIYLPNGVILRDKMYDIGIQLLRKMKFKQILLSDFIDMNSLKSIDEVSKLSDNYLKIEGMDFCMTAGHEISCYSLIREMLRDHSVNYEFPIKYFHFGSVYRNSKNTRFPFNYGERKSFLECYTIHKTSEDAYKAMDEGIEWNRKIVKEILHLPGIEVERPRATNKQISQKSIHIDTITPLGETIITGMTYFHNDVFTKALNVKRKDNKDGKNHYVYSTHFGLSENVLHSYMINCFDGDGFTFYSFLTPVQISIIDTTEGVFASSEEYTKIFNLLDERKFNYEKLEIPSKKISKAVQFASGQGTPVVLILKNVNGNLEVIFSSCQEEFIVKTNDLLNEISIYFSKNDAIVTKKLEKMQRDTVCNCLSIKDVVENVANGKVAAFYCEKTDAKVFEIESYLEGGEVLGFQETLSDQKDILDGRKTNWIAFASRRL